MATKYLQPPPNALRKAPIRITGRQLIDDLKAQGWTEAPTPEPRPRESKRERKYWSDSAFRGY